MNAILIKENVDLLIDRSRNARFSYNQYNLAGRFAQNKLFLQFRDDEIGVRESLFTLIKTSTPTLTTTTATSTYTINHFNYPADYEYFSGIDVFVDGVLTEVVPLANDEENKMLLNTFKIPNKRKTYHLEDGTGYKIYGPPTGVITASFTYLITPSDVYTGNEANQLNAGATLTNLIVYVAIEQSVYNAVTYNPGDSITGTGATLTSGQVILNSILVF